MQTYPTGEDLREQIERTPEIKEHTYKVGLWYWCCFDSKPAPETIAELKRLGFRWNNARRAWQHSNGNWRTRKAPYDPRDKYGIEELTA